MNSALLSYANAYKLHPRNREAVAGLNKVATAYLKSSPDPEIRHARAVELLQQALALCPVSQRASFWEDCIQADAALNPIRASPAFAQLTAQYPRQSR